MMMWFIKLVMVVSKINWIKQRATREGIKRKKARLLFTMMGLTDDRRRMT